MTPVYYTLDMLPENLQRYIRLNPLTTIITYARKGLITADGIRVEDFIQVGIVLLFCIIVFILGRIFFKSKVSKIAEYF
jgi:ABC-type polysaccharide/polyol phosphate export permease